MLASHDFLKPIASAALANGNLKQHNIISILEAASLAVGHCKDVIDLSAPSGRPGLLVSLSKDGNLRIWHASQELCIASYSSDASSLVSLRLAHALFALLVCTCVIAYSHGCLFPLLLSANHVD